MTVRVLFKAARHAGGRMLLAAAAIALGVALGYAVHAVNAAALAELERGLATLAGDADLVVRGPRAGFDESWYPRLAKRAEVAVASPVVELDVRAPGVPEPIKLLGVDVLRAGAIQPHLVGTSAEEGDSYATITPDNVFVSAALAARVTTDSLTVTIGIEPVALRIAGHLPGGAEDRLLAVMDIGAAQDRFGLIGRIQRIDLRLRPGADAAALVAALERELPAGVSIARPAARVDAAARLSRAYRVNLDVLALVALFTGALLVFSMQSLAIVRRRAEIALLRVLGVTRRGIVARLLAEGALLGVAGGLAGLVLGYALAYAVARYIGADLGAGFFRGVSATPRIAPVAALVFLGLGVLAAVAGTWVPAREAARAAPAQALKAGDEERALERVATPWPGLALIVAGAIATRAPPIEGLPVVGYVAIAMLLIGTITVMPAASRGLVRRLPLTRAVPVRLAIAQLRGAPGATSVSLASIVAAVSLAVSMAIMVHSFRVSLGDWLDRLLPAELYLRAAGPSDTTFLSADTQRTLAAIDGIARIEFLRVQRLNLDPGRPEVVLLARDLERSSAAERLPLVAEASVPAGAVPVWVSEQVEGMYAAAPGTALRLPLEGRAVGVTVAGVWRDYGRQQGAIVMTRADYVALTGDRNANDAAIWMSPGAHANVRAALASFASLETYTPGEIRALSLGTFDRTFAVTYGLEAIAVLIGLAGLSAACGALVLARAREFGMLRHVGVTRRQIAVMLAVQGLVTSLLAVVVGFASGWVVSLVLIHVVNRQSFHWSMDLHMPWVVLGAFGALLVLLAVGTAVLAGRRAYSVDVIRSVKDDW